MKTNNNMNTYFNFEIYTACPKTGVSGWDIKNVSVKAETRKEAREKVKTFPYFDCIINFNFEHKENETVNFLIADHYPTYKIIKKF
jgi:hypothetical protein